MAVARSGSRAGGASRAGSGYRLPDPSGSGRLKMSIGTLSSTAPGLPVVAVQNARSAKRFRSSARWTCQVRLLNGR